MNFSSEKPPASVDAVIEQIQTLAGEIHQLGKEVGSRVSKVGARGEQTVTHFDSTFGEIGNNLWKYFWIFTIFGYFVVFGLFIGKNIF
uniref:Uncharacterized protein n=2 Tax=Meloidogyne TaxID=189290 RepID=A0A6V7VLP8_MELEN|nr:unnamed protein product [Meloidogyne enterolobii]